MGTSSELTLLQRAERLRDHGATEEERHAGRDVCYELAKLTETNFFIGLEMVSYRINGGLVSLTCWAEHVVSGYENPRPKEPEVPKKLLDKPLVPNVRRIVPGLIKIPNTNSN